MRHNCTVCPGVSYEDTPANRFAHNTLPWHHLRVLAQCGAPEHLLQQAAIDCEDAVNNLADKLTPAQYEAAFGALPHISGEIVLKSE